MDLNDPVFMEIRRTVRKVLAEELLPNVETTERQGEFCLSAYRKLGELGLLAPILPEPYGANCLFTQTMIGEEMGYVCSGFGLSSLVSIVLFAANVAKFGSQQQKDKYLFQVASGKKIGAWALTEPNVGSDAISIQTRAVKKGDHFLINGSKTLITNAPIADFFIVLARQEGTGFEGATSFILERGMQGLSTGKPFRKMGHRSSPTGELFLKDVSVPESQILGPEGKAFYGMKESLDVERSVFCSLAVGMMDFCLKATVDFTTRRHQFGVPIVEHQMILEKIAEMASYKSLLKTYLYEVIKKMTAGEKVSKEAAIVKLISSDFLQKVTNHAVQCLGGYGYTEEYQVERCYRDAKLFDLGAGTSEIQKLIIGKQAVRELSR